MYTNKQLFDVVTAITQGTPLISDTKNSINPLDGLQDINSVLIKLASNTKGKSKYNSSGYLTTLLYTYSLNKELTSKSGILTQKLILTLPKLSGVKEVELDNLTEIIINSKTGEEVHFTYSARQFELYYMTDDYEDEYSAPFFGSSAKLIPELDLSIFSQEIAFIIKERLSVLNKIS